VLVQFDKVRFFSCDSVFRTRMGNIYNVGLIYLCLSCSL
jgi:hypothetical protein